MNRKVFDYIRSLGMLSPGDSVIVALSGGKDSMALLHVLHTLTRELPISLSAAHYNHNLRDEESLRDEAFVRDYCRDRGIPLTVESGDVAAYAASHRLSIEEAARTLRYEFLLSLSPAAKIATAHTASDNTETVLMHLTRGAGLRGLTGIPPIRGRIIRPLLTCTPGEVNNYLRTHNIPWTEDSTNASDFCLRNRLRHRVIPALLEENPGLHATVAAETQLLAQEEDYLSAEAKATLQVCTVEKGLSVELLRSLHPAMLRRVLRLYLSHVPQLSLRHISDAMALISRDAPSARLSLPGNIILAREYGTLLLSPETACTPPKPLWLLPGECAVFGRYRLSLRQETVPVTARPGEVHLNATGPLLIRTRLSGDMLRLSGGSKTLKKYCIDKKIPAHLRDFLPVAVKQGTVVALPPYAVAWPFRGKPGQTGLTLTVEELEDTPL